MGVPKIFLKNDRYPNYFNLEDFFDSSKKNNIIFVLGAPKVLLGTSATKNLKKSQEFSGVGCLKIFWVKGKTPQTGADSGPPPPLPMD